MEIDRNLFIGNFRQATGAPKFASFCVGWGNAPCSCSKPFCLDVKRMERGRWRSYKL